MTEDTAVDLTTLTADIVAAYVSHNKVSVDALAQLIGDTHRALGAAGAPTPADSEAPKPDKAAIRKSLNADYLTSFLDGRRYKSLKRHLSTQGMTPEEYRARFGLSKDYPMVAPSYSAQRSALARSLGLGRKAAGESPSPAAPTEAAPEKPAKAKRSKAIKADDETPT